MVTGLQNNIIMGVQDKLAIMIFGDDGNFKFVF